MSIQKQYARVQNNTVVEFPLTLEQIVNRGHTENMYHEAISGIKPDVRENETLVSTFDIYEGKVFVKWNLLLLKPEQYYKRIIKSMNGSLGTTVDSFSHEKVTVDANKLQLMQPLLVECVDAMIDVLCDEYAAKMGYKNADRLASYAADPNPSWKADAEAFVGFRSKAYDYMYNAFSMENLVTNNQMSKSIKPSLDYITNLFKGA